MIKITSQTIAGITLFGVLSSACTPVVDKYIPNPALTRRDCADCDMNIFRADSSGTLFSVLSTVQPMLADAPADIRPLFFQVRGMDMQGNMIKTDRMFWNLVFASNSTHQTYHYEMDTSGTVKLSVSEHQTVSEYLDAINGMKWIYNIKPFANVTLAALLANGLADTPQVMANIIASPSYHASGYGLGVETYEYNGNVLPIGAYYAESVDADIATEVTYDGNGIEVIINDESEWVIVDFPPEQRPYGDKPKSEWILTHYGEVSRANYLAARKSFKLNLNGTLN